MRRRQVLKAGGATLAAPLLVPLLRPLDAFAKTEQIVVMTWGGQWGDAMRDNVDAAFEKATGIKVVQDRGASPADRITKLKVSQNNPVADCFQLADGLVPLAIRQGVAEKINRDSPRMPNLRNMIPTFWNDYWVPQIFSVIGIVYNTKEVKSPPTGWSDLWRRSSRAAWCCPRSRTRSARTSSRSARSPRASRPATRTPASTC